MKNLLVVLSLVTNALARQPLQPVVVDGDNSEWRRVSANSQEFGIGEARSILTNGFLYLSVEANTVQEQLTLEARETHIRVNLDVRSGSGSIYIGRHSLRFPFFDGVLGIESATKGKTTEMRVPSVIFGSDQIILKVSNDTLTLKPERVSQGHLPDAGGVSKLSAILQPESDSQSHIRLMDSQTRPLSAICAVTEKEFEKAAEILTQIAESDQPNLKPWALASLAEVVVWLGDLERSKQLRREAVKNLDKSASIGQLQESVRQKMKLKVDPIKIINSIGDLSAVNADTRYRVGRLWTITGNYPEAARVFDGILRDYPDTYYARRARWYLDTNDRKDDNGQLYEVYQLVSDQRWADVASIYKQAREDESDFLHPLVSMLHRLDAFNPVFVEYLKIR